MKLTLIDQFVLWYIRIHPVNSQFHIFNDLVKSTGYDKHLFQESLLKLWNEDLIKYSPEKDSPEFAYKRVYSLTQKGTEELDKPRQQTQEPETIPSHRGQMKDLEFKVVIREWMPVEGYGPPNGKVFVIVHEDVIVAGNSMMNVYNKFLQALNRRDKLYSPHEERSSKREI